RRLHDRPAGCADQRRPDDDRERESRGDRHEHRAAFAAAPERAPVELELTRLVGHGSTLADAVTPARRVTSAVSRPGRKDRKSTRLNSSHVKISYAVFCLKKK